MSPLAFVLVCLAGGLGAGARFLVDEAIKARVAGSLPAGTFTVNILGSFLLGVVMGLGSGGQLSADATAVLGAGALGGFTTFSTASVEVIRLGMARRVGVGIAYAVTSAVLAVGLAALGFGLASWLAG